MWRKGIIIIRDERARCEIFWQLQFQSLMVRYLIAIKCQNWWPWPELGTQPRLAVVTTHTIIAVMVQCYLGFNGLTCWFTRIVNIFEYAYIIWVCKTLSKCNIFSDAPTTPSMPLSRWSERAIAWSVRKMGTLWYTLTKRMLLLPKGKKSFTNIGLEESGYRITSARRVGVACTSISTRYIPVNGPLTWVVEVESFYFMNRFWIADPHVHGIRWKDCPSHTR